MAGMGRLNRFYRVLPAWGWAPPPVQPGKARQAVVREVNRRASLAHPDPGVRAYA
jgi:hypothetical protein